MSSIYFDRIKIAQIIGLMKDACDCVDVLNDIKRIECVKESALYSGDYAEAKKLDQELRTKYPCIKKMLDIADRILLSSGQSGAVGTKLSVEIELLNQDFYGIICGTAIKKGIEKCVEDLILKVE